MLRPAVLLIGVSLVLLLSMSPGSSSGTYPGTVTEVECGGTYANPEAVGNNIVVGQWSVTSTSHAFSAPVPNPPTTTTITQCTMIDPPNATFAIAWGVSSASNVIVGFYMTGKGSSQQSWGFIRDPSGSGVFSSFNIGSARTVPRGINNLTMVVGSLGNETQAFAANAIPGSGGAYTVPTWVTFTFPGAGSTEVTGINDSYAIAGNAFTNHTFIVGDFDTGSRHGFWGTLAFSSGTTISGTSTLRQFDCDGSSGTKPYGINDSGMMVGVTTIGRTSKGFITTFDPVAGTFPTNCATYLIPSTSKSTVFTGVNSRSGGAQISGGFSGAFVLTPQ